MSLQLKIKDSPHYDKIVNFLYEDNNFVSNILIDCYQQYLFNIKTSKSINNIDKIMNDYTDKTSFYNYVNDYFKENNNELYDSYDKVILKLNKLYKNYEEDKFKKINPSRWL